MPHTAKVLLSVGFVKPNVCWRGGSYFSGPTQPYASSRQLSTVTDLPKRHHLSRGESAKVLPASPRQIVVGPLLLREMLAERDYLQERA